MGVVLILISFVASFMMVAGCMKPPKTEVDYGPEYRKAEVSQALKLAMGDSTPTDIKFEEFSQTDLTRVIRGRAIIDLLETVGLTIVNREETPRQIQLNMVEERLTYDLSESHNNKKLVREYLDCMNKSTLKAENCESLALPNPTAEPSPTSEPSPTVVPNPTEIPEATVVPSPTAEPSSSIVSVAVHSKATINGSVITTAQMIENSLTLFPDMSRDPDDDSRTSYHQLKVSERIAAPPKLVQDSPNCGGIPNCLIHITDIEFDQVNWLSYNKGDKIHIKISTSKDVPYLSRILEKCQQGSVPIKQEGKPEKDWPRLLVTFCETVRNFKKGE
jgi:hypothetical protein